MLKKILYWFLGFIVLLLLTAGVALYYANDYLESDQEKLLEDYMATKGMSVALRNVRLEIWKDFPEISLTVDSFVVRDTTKAVPVVPLVNAQRIQTRISLEEMLKGRIRIEEIIVLDAVLHLESDSNGVFNHGMLAERDTTEKDDGESGGPSPISFDWEGLLLDLDRVDIHYIHPQKEKRILALARCVQSRIDRTEAGELHTIADVDLDFETLDLKTSKGGYLQDSRVTGPFEITFGDSAILLAPSQVMINGQLFHLGATIQRDPEAISHIQVGADSIGYEATRRILNPVLQEKLGDFHVSGRFPAQANILTPLSSGSDPEVTVHFNMTGQDVRLKQYQFERVYGHGFLINRLSEAEGGLPNSKKNLRVEAHDVKAVYLGNVLIETPFAHVGVAGKDPILRSDLHLSGPASAVSDYLKNDAFFFRRGRFRMDAEVDHSLLDFEGIVTTTDGEIRFTNTRVAYEPAGISFPFRDIEVGKRGDDIRFQIASQPISTGFEFQLLGDIDNLAPLLIDLPHGQINTNVQFKTPNLNWTDFRALFGEGGELTGLTNQGGDAGARIAGEEQSGGTPTRSEENTALGDAEQVAAMKSTLLGLEDAFNPNLDLQFDTLAYYDLFDLTDFNTGLHFNRDTLILERTTFHWAGSDMNFGARVDLDEPGQTPFTLDFLVEHLNVNRIREPLNYFGLQLPKELDRLPDDMHIEFSHVGRIEDTIGISPGYNSGYLLFDDGRDQLFSGRLDYAPSPEGIHTTVHLNGDPRVVNVMFAAENFFFGEGTFAVDLDVSGTPEDLAQVVRTGKFNLSIADSRIHYRPADVFIPVRKFNVQVAEERAEYDVELVTDSTNRSVTLVGFMDHLSNFLYPDSVVTPDPFRVEADLRAPVLGYADLADFIELNDSSKTERDSAGFDLKAILSATGGVFNSFRPNLSLRIDTFHLTPATSLFNVATGMRVRNDRELLLERTGFVLDDGSRVALDAVYALDSLDVSPFAVHWRVEDLNVGRLFGELKDAMNMDGDSIGDVSGRISFTGDLSGYLDEPGQRVVYDSTNGNLAYRLTGLSLDDWLPLEAMGRKAFMADRFQHVGIAPLMGELQIVNGLATVPRMELQTTPLQLFIEGEYSLTDGPDLLVSIPVWKNLFRGVLERAPEKTGYADAGWKVFLSASPGEDGQVKTKFRLGRRKWHKERGTMAEFRALKRKK